MARVIFAVLSWDSKLRHSLFTSKVRKITGKIFRDFLVNFLTVNYIRNRNYFWYLFKYFKFFLATKLQDFCEKSWKCSGCFIEIEIFFEPTLAQTLLTRRSILNKTESQVSTCETNNFVNTMYYIIFKVWNRRNRTRKLRKGKNFSSRVFWRVFSSIF